LRGGAREEGEVGEKSFGVNPLANPPP
jgi:hypothetical protein